MSAKINKSKKESPLFGDVLRLPLSTEKSSLLAKQRQYVFKVADWADKTWIKRSVESIFDVKVLSVNTVRLKKKKKVFRGKVGFRKGFSKAYVTLATGQHIALGAAGEVVS